MREHVDSPRRVVLVLMDECDRGRNVDGSDLLHGPAFVIDASRRIPLPVPELVAEPVVEQPDVVAFVGKVARHARRKLLVRVDEAALCESVQQQHRPIAAAVVPMKFQGEDGRRHMIDAVDDRQIVRLASDAGDLRRKLRRRFQGLARIFRCAELPEGRLHDRARQPHGIRDAVEDGVRRVLAGRCGQQSITHDVGHVDVQPGRRCEAERVDHNSCVQPGESLPQPWSVFVPREDLFAFYADASRTGLRRARQRDLVGEPAKGALHLCNAEKAARISQ
jgi:hypothetical protein